MNYRADIQILRGLSVTMVVLYHLNLGVVQSGFLGVDIFFVISGFLMARLYLPKGDEHSPLAWSVIKPFLVRRAQRILPAYVFIVFAVLIYGFLALHNAEYRALTNHSLYVALLIPNVGDWLQASYFESANFRPLLHLWSLGVELQFYLIVPVIFAIFNRSRGMLIALAALSFIACLAFAGRAPSAAFFLLPFRIWEFLIGFFCAKMLVDVGIRERDLRHIGSAAFIGLLGLIALDLGEQLRHPGLPALLACLLSATILACGLPKEFENGIFARAFEVMGKYSYSIYVVHYPIILLFVYQPFVGTEYSFIASWDLSLLVAMIAIASLVCFHLVEQPFRRASNPRAQGVAAIVLLLAIYATAGALNSAQLKSYTTEQRMVANAVHDRSAFRCGSAYELFRPLSQSCVLTPGNTKQDNYLLVGNSHADSLKSILAELAEEHDASLRIWKDNFPLGWGKTNTQTLLVEIRKHQIKHVIIHQSRDTLRIDELNALVAAAEAEGVTIHYIDPIPVWDESVPKMTWHSLTQGAELPYRTIGEHHSINFAELSQLNGISSPAFHRVYISFAACPHRCQLLSKEGMPLYYDSHHLNLTGARSLKPRLASIFVGVSNS